MTIQEKIAEYKLATLMFVDMANENHLKINNLNYCLDIIAGAVAPIFKENAHKN